MSWEMCSSPWSTWPFSTTTGDKLRIALWISLCPHAGRAGLSNLPFSWTLHVGGEGFLLGRQKDSLRVEPLPESDHFAAGPHHAVTGNDYAPGTPGYPRPDPAWR